MEKLGEILRQRELITEEQLNRALDLQTRSGDRLGDILISDGAIGHLALYQALAEHHRLPFLDLLKQPPDPELMAQARATACLRLRAVPWRKREGKIIMALCEMTEDATAWARKTFGEEIEFAITSPLDIRRAVEAQFGKAMEQTSRLALWRRQPEASARSTLPARQQQFLYGAAAIAVVIFAVAPVKASMAALIICHLAYAATMIFKWLIFSRGALIRTQQDWEGPLAALDERELPVYTVLIPMYQEAQSLPGLLEWMQRLDYPPARLDIKLVLEEDDDKTLHAAYALKPRYHFDIIRVPHGTPRTKPRACNYALRFARGEMVTVFDVDDRPEKLQLKKAVLAFRFLPADVACVQARLNYYNADDNLLTRFFSLEYTILFHFLLYGLQRLAIPIPLGGTSNHIALARLRQLGEWDPYNVTEDADLGTRLAARGLRTVMLDSYTMEEAPNRLMPWIRQRSRWIKGYMQTWLVHMRNPAALYRALGLRGFIGFQFFVGLSCFTFLTAPLVWGLSLAWAGYIGNWQALPLPAWLVWLAFLGLLLNLFSHWYMGLYCAALYRKHQRAVRLAGILYPFYLLLHSIASYKALWQLFVRPHFWEKTVHGLARHFDSMAAESGYAPKRRISLTAGRLVGKKTPRF